MLSGFTTAPSPSPTPSPRAILEEAHITELSCHGARITQEGLNPGHHFEVLATDPATRARFLDLGRTTSDATGHIDVRLSFDLAGADRIHIEVEDVEEEAEYGETGTDVPFTCRSKKERLALLASGGLAVAAVVVGAILLVRRRRRPGAAPPVPASHG